MMQKNIFSIPAGGWFDSTRQALQHRTVISVLAGFMATALLGTEIATCQTSVKGDASCENVTLLSAHPLSELPKATQQILRRAVRPKLQAIIHDPGMGMSATILNDIPLKAVEIARTSKSRALYVVAWDDDSFGVNGFNSIVEIRPGGAVSLLSDHASSVAGGFGVKVLGGKSQSYPEIMFASKGYAEGIGAIAKPVCFQKIGRSYENIPCPASCPDELNSD